MSSQVQDFTSVFAELHKVLFSLLFQPTQIFLQDGSPVQNAHFLSQFGILGKLYQGPPDPITQINY